MPRGENKAFKENHGRPLHPVLKRNALEKYVEKWIPDLNLEDIDVESFITEKETFREDLQSLLAAYNEPARSVDVISEAELENELEKYRYRYSKYVEQHKSSHIG